MPTTMMSATTTGTSSSGGSSSSSRKKRSAWRQLLQQPRHLCLILLGCILGLIARDFTNLMTSSSTSNHGREPGSLQQQQKLEPASLQQHQSFFLLVTLEFKDESSKGRFIEVFQPLAQYIEQNEPDTLSYEVLLSDKNPLQVTILERYKDKYRAYLKVHRSSKPFQTFRPKLQGMVDDGEVVKIEGQSYLDSQIGFLSR